MYGLIKKYPNKGREKQANKRLVLQFSYSLRKVLLASNLTERNHCVNHGVSTQNEVSDTSCMKWPSVMGNHAFKNMSYL